MDETPARRDRLTLADVSILVAAAAVAFSVFRLIAPILRWTSPWPNLFSRPNAGWGPWEIYERAIEAQVPLLPFAIAWTLALPVLQLRRGPWRRAVRRPGMIACLAAIQGGLLTFVSMGFMLCYALAVASTLRLGPIVWVARSVKLMFAPIGLAVLVAWTTLALSGRWRRPADWIDRSGRALGVFWLVVGLEYGGLAFIELL